MTDAEILEIAAKVGAPINTGRTALTFARALLARAPCSQVAVPEGMALVPIEPTEAMHLAGRKSCAAVADKMEEAKLLATSAIDFWQRVGHNPERLIWDAMIAAALPGSAGVQPNDALDAAAFRAMVKYGMTVMVDAEGWEVIAIWYMGLREKEQVPRGGGKLEAARKAINRLIPQIEAAIAAAPKGNQ